MGSPAEVSWREPLSSPPEDAPRQTVVSPESADAGSTGTADYPPTPAVDVGRSRARLVVNWRNLLTELLVPLLAIFTALLIGALIIEATGHDIGKAYSGLFMGALGTPTAIATR
jgi:hypothetical protein